jgi:hypothetical protein
MRSNALLKPGSWLCSASNVLPEFTLDELLTGITEEPEGEVEWVGWCDYDRADAISRL